MSAFKTLSLGIDNPRLVSLDAFPTLRSDEKEPQTTTPSKKITFDPHFVCMCRVVVMYNSLISIVLLLFISSLLTTFLCPSLSHLLLPHLLVCTCAIYLLA